MLAGQIDGASSLISGLAHVNYSTAIFYEHCACLPACLPGQSKFISRCPSSVVFIGQSMCI